ncbi:Hypothetical_protein [Hexamita inflata]|uniref:Hypothetical_protein n=1 Tax=Hexamita inflata TaxID=28002 RepID=A0AA86QQ85_9EUKA|nr:Hypothetical protein HINF_LOCUS49843 [Hexamita inflata]
MLKTENSQELAQKPRKRKRVLLATPLDQSSASCPSLVIRQDMEVVVKRKKKVVRRDSLPQQVEPEVELPRELSFCAPVSTPQSQSAPTAIKRKPVKIKLADHKNIHLKKIQSGLSTKFTQYTELFDKLKIHQRFAQVAYTDLIQSVQKAAKKSNELLDLQNAFKIEADRNVFCVESFVSEQLKIDSSHSGLFDFIVEMEAYASESAFKLKQEEFETFTAFFEGIRKKIVILVAQEEDPLQDRVPELINQSEKFVENAVEKLQSKIDAGDETVIEIIEKLVGEEQKMQDALFTARNIKEAEKIAKSVQWIRKEIEKYF